MLAMAVKMMLAIDVPKAMCKVSAGGNKPCAANIKVRAGTNTRPPPIPSIPARTPEQAPRARYDAIQNMLMLY